MAYGGDEPAGPGPRREHVEHVEPLARVAHLPERHPVAAVRTRRKVVRAAGQVVREHLELACVLPAQVVPVIPPHPQVLLYIQLNDIELKP